MHLNTYIASHIIRVVIALHIIRVVVHLLVLHYHAFQKEKQKKTCVVAHSSSFALFYISCGMRVTLASFYIPVRHAYLTCIILHPLRHAYLIGNILHLREACVPHLHHFTSP